MYDYFLVKSLFYYDITNREKKDKKQGKKIFFIQNFVSNLQLQLSPGGIIFCVFNPVTIYESSSYFME